MLFNRFTITDAKILWLWSCVYKSKSKCRKRGPVKLTKIKACNRLQYFWFLMKFIKNFEWISFTVMEFPQTNRTFCKVILSKPNKPFHFIFRNIASKIISGQYINVNGEKMILVVFWWPISQPQFGFDWCTGSLTIQHCWRSRAESGLLRAKKVYKCPHPIFRWRPINLKNLGSTNVKLPVIQVLYLVEVWTQDSSVTNII